MRMQGCQHARLGFVVTVVKSHPLLTRPRDGRKGQAPVSEAASSGVRSQFWEGSSAGKLAVCVSSRGAPGTRSALSLQLL